MLKIRVHLENVLCFKFLKNVLKSPCVCLAETFFGAAYKMEVGPRFLEAFYYSCGVVGRVVIYNEDVKIPGGNRLED